MGDISEGVNAVFYISLVTIFCTSFSLAIKFCYKSKCKQVDLCCLKMGLPKTNAVVCFLHGAPN